MELTNLLVLIPFLLCWGSFLNVLSYRLIRGQNIAKPRSHCPTCQHSIAWYDNIPVFSWILLGGLCRHCKKLISALYPVIELLTTLVMTLLFFLVPTRFIPAYFILFSALIVSIRSDLETLLISQYVTIFLIPVGILCSFLQLLPITPLQSFSGAVFGYLFLWTLASLFLVLTGKRGMGDGDFELLGLIGSFLGIHGTWVTLMTGSMAGSLIGLSLIMRGNATRTTKIPFGPFLALAAIAYILVSFAYWPQSMIGFS
jgi:leader peptidase (prepilin peptidase) / N-methyltransferase